jgi:hypothetical protein
MGKEKIYETANLMAIVAPTVGTADFKEGITEGQLKTDLCQKLADKQHILNSFFRGID